MAKIKGKPASKDLKGALVFYGEGLVEKLRAGKLDPRKLSREERRACVAVLRHEPITNRAICGLLGVTEPTFYNDLKIIRQGLGILVESLTVEAIVGDFYDKSQHLYSKAIQKEDFNLAHRINVDTLAKLQDLGYVRKVLGEFTLKDEIGRMEGGELDVFIEKELTLYERYKVIMERGVKVRVRRKRGAARNGDNGKRLKNGRVVIDDGVTVHDGEPKKLKAGRKVRGKVKK